MIEISLNTNDLHKARQALQALGRQASPLVARALTRSARGVATDASRLVRGVYNVRAAQVRKSFRVASASRDRLAASASSTGRNVSLIHFGARPGKPGGRRPRRGVSVSVMSGRKIIPGSFVARMPNGGVGVFRRKEGAGRLPIRKLVGPSVPQMLDHEDVQPGLESGAHERFNKTLDHELDRYFQRKGLR